MIVQDETGSTEKYDIPVEDKVTFLQGAGNYPYKVRRVKVRETHMSWVFLAGDFVYKLKKPVHYSFFDHRTLASRFKNSREEVRINYPLAADIYIGIVPLVIDEKEQLRLEGQGEIVDWLVKMKRIPEESMLDYAIEHRRIDESNLKEAAVLLAGFYKKSAPVSLNLPEFLGKLEAEILFNFNKLTNPLFRFPPNLLIELKAGQLAFLATHVSLFQKRIKDKRIIDAHGDLRPEHICLLPKPAIIDRLEFSKKLRIMDTAEELAQLSLECEKSGSAVAGQLFIDVHEKISGDKLPEAIIEFYKIKRACLRAYLVVRHIEEVRYKDDPKWIHRANEYLGLAEKFHQELAGVV